MDDLLVMLLLLLNCLGDTIGTRRRLSSRVQVVYERRGGIGDRRAAKCVIVAIVVAGVTRHESRDSRISLDGACLAEAVRQAAKCAIRAGAQFAFG